MDVVDLDGLIDSEHQARSVWLWVSKLDLSPLMDALKARGSNPGRAAIDPHILLSLWLYATLDGVGSARLIARLCTEHHAYRWIAGGVSINYHTLSDFRVLNTEFLDRLLSTSMAALIDQGLVKMNAVAQDGMRVRACASRSSFRKKEKLEELHRQCCQQIHALKAQLDEQPNEPSKRQQAARQRAEREREERLNAAMENIKLIEDSAQALRKRYPSKKPSGGGGPGASTTDPDARLMKMANGGFDPAYNVQYVTDVDTGFVVGCEVIKSGTDFNYMKPLNDQLEQRYGARPRAVLADAGYRQLNDITLVERAGTAVYLPPWKDKPATKRQRTDTAETVIWRQRMETEEAKALFKKRSSTAEFSNARARNQGLRQLLVRGLLKVKAVALWHALAINLRVAFRLQLA
jgi:transposase